MIELIEQAASANEGEFEYVMFLMHPWELVDLGKHHPNLKKWVIEICKDDMPGLEGFFSDIKKRFNITTVGEIGKKIKNRDNSAASG